MNRNGSSDAQVQVVVTGVPNTLLAKDKTGLKRHINDGKRYGLTFISSPCSNGFNLMQDTTEAEITQQARARSCMFF